MEHEQHTHKNSDELLDQESSELASEGVIFSRIPEGVYPGMEYITANDLVNSNKTRYSVQHIKLLVRTGRIPGFRLAGKVILTPKQVTQLLEHENESLQQPNSGRHPGHRSQN